MHIENFIPNTKNFLHKLHNSRTQSSSMQNNADITASNEATRKLLRNLTTHHQHAWSGLRCYNIPLQRFEQHYLSLPRA